MKRAVRQRDGDQCTFISESGRRCTERKHLEFDHVHEVARGGEATLDNIRLRCREHNQFTAERTFGAVFMKGKREQARARAAAAREIKEAAERTEQTENVIACLRKLGYKTEDARAAAAYSESVTEGTLEDRVRRSLTYFAPRAHTHTPAPASAG